MYEKITCYLDSFVGDAAGQNEKIEAFASEFMQSEFMNPNAMEAMGERMWASKTKLREDAPSMTADEVCICLSAFVQQEAFIPGILADLIKQGVIPAMLQRLKELDK